MLPIPNLFRVIFKALKISVFILADDLLKMELRQVFPVLFQWNWQSMAHNQTWMKGHYHPTMG